MTPLDDATREQLAALAAGQPVDERVKDVNLARTFAVYEDEGYNIAAKEADDRTCPHPGDQEHDHETCRDAVLHAGESS